MMASARAWPVGGGLWPSAIVHIPFPRLPHSISRFVRFPSSLPKCQRRKHWLQHHAARAVGGCPLMVTDRTSCYLLACEALGSTKEHYAFTVFERLFKERGLSGNIRSDNGGPFASAHALFNLSSLIRVTRLGFTTTYKPRGLPKTPASCTRHRKLWVGKSLGNRALLPGAEPRLIHFNTKPTIAPSACSMCWYSAGEFGYALRCGGPSCFLAVPRSTAFEIVRVLRVALALIVGVFGKRA